MAQLTLILLCILVSSSYLLSPLPGPLLTYFVKNPLFQARFAGCRNDKGDLVPCFDLDGQVNSCSDESVEYYSDPTDCHKYFRCVNGVSYQYDCAPGTAWNKDTANCVLEDNVECHVDEESTANDGILMNYNYRQMTPDSLRSDAKKLMQDIEDGYDRVGAVIKAEVSFSTVIKPLLDLDVDTSPRSSVLFFAANVAENKDLRDAANEFQKQLSELEIELSLRKDVFENIKTFAASDEANHLEPEQKRYVEDLLRSGKRNGLQLSGEVLDQFKVIKKKISELGIDFDRCLSEDTSHIWVAEKDLTGVSQDLIDTLEKNDATGLLKVTTKYPHYHPVIKRCSNPKTRFAMEKAFQSRCFEQNTPIIEELLQLRQKQADILGYPSHAAYQQEEKMAKNPENVAKFLSELTTKLKPLWETEKQVMLKLKEAEAIELKFDFDGKINKEDFWYYNSLVQTKKYSVDQNELKEYFPIDVVTKGLMQIYQTLLGLTFFKVEEANAWHDEVDLYRVDDTASQETIGYFYMDMFPREGKFGHAAMWQLEPGSLDSDGNRRKAVAVMVCNFPRPTEDKPSLLEHKQVTTYFHEFGHVMHGITSRTNTSVYFGTNVEGDFVEAPSQMLENWVWEEESLKMMSAHYKDKTPLPQDLLNKLVASKQANVGGKTMRQIYFATLDQKLHAAKPAEEKVDTVSVARDLYRELLGIERIEGGNIAASLGHLVGYDAGYYGYLWSEVFSQDMFDTRFAVEGILNPQTGMDYRQMILGPGGSLDGEVMLRNFLGRDPNQAAFLKSKGIEL